MSMFRNLLTLAVLFGLSVATLTPSFAQEAEKKEDAPATVAEVDKSLPLSARQRAIRARFKRFYHTLTQMHEYMRKTDPDRADLLKRAIESAGENRISSQLERIVEMMDQQDVLYGDVIDRQEELTKHLNALLDLLQSEDRLSDIEKEKKRIEELLKDVRELIGKEKVVRAQTERGGDEDRIAGKQQKVADDTADLGKKIDKQDAAKNGDSKDSKPGEKKDGKSSDPKDGKPSDSKDGKPSDGKPKDGKPSDGKPADGKPSDGKPGDKKDEKKDGKDDKKPGDKKDQKPGDKKDAKPKDGKPSDGKPQDGKPQDGKPSDGKPKAGKPKDSQPKPQPKPPEGGETIPGKKKPGQDDDKPGSQQKKNRTPGREELEKAHAEMERAIEELKKKNRKGASEAEDEALAELIKAKEKLEEILRQLREEERELILAALEARFRKMLAMQFDVLNGTDQVSRVSKSEWQENHRGEMQRLTAREQEIAREAEKALTILKAEGTSFAFPLAVEGIRDDVLTISDLLARLQDGDQDPMDPFAPEGQEVRMQRDKMFELTIGLEKDVIAALKELIEALQKEMEKDKKDKDGKPCDCNGDPVLVDKLAELKMLRTLQMRVNRQTKRLGLQVDGEQATQPFVVAKLKQLAKLQAKIQKTAYDLATTRNQ